MIQHLLSLLLIALLVIVSSVRAHAPVSRASVAPAFDTEHWIGAEYTPSPAGNQLWLYEWERYAPIVQRELAAASELYGMSMMRVFLHSMLHANDSTKFLNTLDSLLTVASQHHIRLGFVFFDDCWDAAGATLPDSCKPVQGRHNGCWKTSPQTVERTSVDRFQSYVTETVTRFAQDPRVLWWEIFNEPNSSNFTSSLRTAAFGWAMSAKPAAPVLSCWDDNADTQVVDVHRYSTDFADWNKDVYSNPAKGALVTEAGSRWFQGTTDDAGSQKNVLSWLFALREAKAAGKVPFVPGASISWELNVGNSNTRWHWGTPDGFREPSIPWDANLHADQTPISWTERALILNYTTGRNVFRFVETFTPSSITNSGDSFKNVSANSTWSPTSDLLDLPALYEYTFWPTAGSEYSMSMGSIVKSNNGAVLVNINVATQLLQVQLRDGASITTVGSFNYSSIPSGVPLDGWSIVQALVLPDQVHVWLNPTHPEAISPTGISPRLSVKLPSSVVVTRGPLVVKTGNGHTAFDYISATLPHYRLIQKLEANSALFS